MIDQAIQDRIRNTLCNISEARAEAQCYPTSDVPLLFLGEEKKAHYGTIKPPDWVQYDFRCSVTSIGTGRNARVKMPQSSGVELSLSMRDLISTYMTQIEIVGSIPEGRRVLKEIVASDEYSANPDLHSAFVEYARDPTKGEEIALWVNPKTAGLGFCMMWVGFTGLFMDKDKTEMKKDNALEFAVRGNHYWYIRAYKNVIRPVIIQYVQIEKILGQKCGLDILWSPVTQFNPGFETIAAIVPEDRLTRVVDCIQRMEQAFNDHTTDSYMTFVNVSNIYAQFLNAVKQLNLRAQALQELSTSEDPSILLGSISETRIDTAREDWESQVVRHAQIIAQVLMKGAIYGSGSNPNSSIPLFGFDTRPNCSTDSNTAGSYTAIYERQNVTQINEDIPAHVQHTLYRACGEQEIDFSPENFSISVNSYLNERNESYQGSKDALRSSVFSLMRKLSESPPPNQSEAPPNRSHITQILNSLASLPNDLFGIRIIADQAIRFVTDLAQIGSYVIQNCGNEIEDLYSSYQEFVDREREWELLSEIRGLMDWYRSTSHILENPRVVAVKLEIRNNRIHRINPITIEY